MTATEIVLIITTSSTAIGFVVTRIGDAFKQQQRAAQEDAKQTALTVRSTQIDEKLHAITAQTNGNTTELLAQIRELTHQVAESRHEAGMLRAEVAGLKTQRTGPRSTDAPTSVSLPAALTPGSIDGPPMKVEVVNTPLAITARP